MNMMIYGSTKGTASNGGRMSDAEKDLDYFIAKFSADADEARDYGLHVVILIENVDPISRGSSVSKIFRGTVTTSIGLLQGALFDFQQR